MKPLLILQLLIALSGAKTVFAAGDGKDSNDPIPRMIAMIVSKADSHEDAAAMVPKAAEFGAAAVIESARHIDPTRLARNAVLMEIVAGAGQGRRSNPELLKRYDPPAYRLYYLHEGLTDQRLIGTALALPAWPQKLPEAMVRAAPQPTIEWMAEQAKAAQPPLEKLRLLWQTWGFWVRAGHERQFEAELDAVVAQLAKNRALIADEATAAALVRLAGDVKSQNATGFILDQLVHGPVSVRAEAATACGRLGSDAAANAIVRAGRVESEPFVQQKIASAADAWPAGPDVGAMLLALFDRTKSPAVRREILFSCGDANWPARSELLVRAFDVPDNGVLGAALLGLASRPESTALDRVLKTAAEAADAEPPLIDALGAYRDSRATPHLMRWLAKQENPVVRVKLVLALEKVSASHDTDALLLKLLRDDPSAMVVEQVEGIVGRRKVGGGESILITLAEDHTAPLQLRIAAITALGHFATTEVRQAIERLNKDAETLFKGTAGRPADSEVLDVVRLTIALAKIELGDRAGDDELQKAYDRSTSLGQLTALVGLAQTGRDHPIIRQALATTDMAVLFGAVRAAAAADPVKYHNDLIRLRQAPFIDTLFNSGLDSANLRPTLDAAIAKGQKP